MSKPSQISHNVSGNRESTANLVADRDDNDRLIGSLSDELREGSVIALRGPSGSGHKSYARVLSKLLDPRTRDVQLGADSYDDLASSQVRQRVGFVDDAAHIFATTLRANVHLLGLTPLATGSLVPFAPRDSERF